MNPTPQSANAQTASPLKRRAEAKNVYTDGVISVLHILTNGLFLDESKSRLDISVVVNILKEHIKRSCPDIGLAVQ